MMDALEFLKILMYLLGSTFLVVLIILGIRLIGTLGKVDNTVDNINKKLSSLDGMFAIIDGCTDKLSLISDNIVNQISSIISKMFTKRKERKSKDE